MIRFEHPEYLYLLTMLPIVIGVFVFALVMRKRNLKKLGDEHLILRLMPEYSKYKPLLKFILLSVAIVFLCISLANPQMGTKTKKVNRKSVDIFIAFDISQSMMAQDIVPNRLERAKKFVRELIEGLAGDRLGLIIFAGNAYLQVPLTTDYAALDLMLRSVNPNQAPTQGTVITEAIDLAEGSFPEDNKNHKALIVVSDGENHEEKAIDRVKTANKNGLIVFTVGVGTTEGSFIPVVINGQPDYKRDLDDSPIRSGLNEELMKTIAKAGEGAYFNLANETEEIISAVRNRVDLLEKRELEQRIFDEYNSYFQYFLIIAILLLVIEFLLNYRRNNFFAEKDLFKG